MVKNTAWIEKRKNIIRMVWAFVILCIVLICLDLIIHRHSVFDWESWVGFYGIYGFLACVLLVFAAKILRKIIMRKEDYYDK